jgi:hypothetical protein
MRLVSKKYLIVTNVLFWLFSGAFWFYTFLGFLLPLDSGNWYIPMCGLLGIIVLVRLNNIVNKSKWQPLIIFGAVVLGFIVSLSWWLYYSRADIPQPTWDTAFFGVTMMAVFFLIPMVGYVLSLPLQWQMWKVLSSGVVALEVIQHPDAPGSFVLRRRMFEEPDYVQITTGGPNTLVLYETLNYATVFQSRESAASIAVQSNELVIVF